MNNNLSEVLNSIRIDWEGPIIPSRNERLKKVHLTLESLGVKRNQWPKTVGISRDGEHEILKILNLSFVAEQGVFHVVYLRKTPNGGEAGVESKRYTPGDTVVVIPFVRTQQGPQIVLRTYNIMGEGNVTEIPRGFDPDDGENPICILERNMPGLVKMAENIDWINVTEQSYEDLNNGPQKLHFFIADITLKENADFTEQELKKALKEANPNNRVISNPIRPLLVTMGIAQSYKKHRESFQTDFMRDQFSRVALFESDEAMFELAGLEYVSPQKQYEAFVEYNSEN